jgi:hypothetical protein
MTLCEGVLVVMEVRALAWLAEAAAVVAVNVRGYAEREAVRSCRCRAV